VREENCQQIRKWFGASEVGPGLILPNGWFGPPHSTQHALTFLVALKHKVLLELDEQVLLSFTELGNVREEGADLVLSPFLQLVLDWQESGSLEPRSYLYRSGEVRFVRESPAMASHETRQKAESRGEAT
jgi:hypothetical protein